MEVEVCGTLEQEVVGEVDHGCTRSDNSREHAYQPDVCDGAEIDRIDDSYSGACHRGNIIIHVLVAAVLFLLFFASDAVVKKRLEKTQKHHPGEKIELRVVDLLSHDYRSPAEYVISKSGFSGVCVMVSKGRRWYYNIFTNTIHTGDDLPGGPMFCLLAALHEAGHAITPKALLIIKWGGYASVFIAALSGYLRSVDLFAIAVVVATISYITGGVYPEFKADEIAAEHIGGYMEINGFSKDDAKRCTRWATDLANQYRIVHIINGFSSILVPVGMSALLWGVKL